jgi:hypothetical protein
MQRPPDTRDFLYRLNSIGDWMNNLDIHERSQSTYIDDSATRSLMGPSHSEIQVRISDPKFLTGHHYPDLIEAISRIETWNGQ